MLDAPAHPLARIALQDTDRYQHLIRILDPDGKGSRPIVEVRHSLMCALSAQAWYAVRVYLLPADKEHLRAQIRATF